MDFGGLPALLRNKAWLALCMGFWACGAPAVKKLDLHTEGISFRNGTCYLNDALYTGTLYELGSRGDTLSVESYRQGKAHGRSCSWYPGGQVKETRYYEKGKRQGVHYGYWENGNMKFEHQYENDLFEGCQQEWHRNGMLFKKSHYGEGHEQGLQQVWDTIGILKVNYEARNGRNYGNIGEKSCRGVRH